MNAVKSKSNNNLKEKMMRKKDGKIQSLKVNF